MSVGLALIVKDEEKTLPGLLGSIEGAFDQVVLLDTGSTDRTRKVFWRWAMGEVRRNPAFRYVVEEFVWVDDFAAARNAAQALLDTDWVVWADADDEIRGALNLRQIAQAAPRTVAGYAAGYDYARDDQGNCVCWLRRERMVRRGKGVWRDPIHECQTIDGPVLEIPAEQVCWVHRKNHEADAKSSSGRNIRILSTWLDSDPSNLRALSYLGTEYLVRGEHAEALPFFDRYLGIVEQAGPGGPMDEEFAQVCRKAACCHLQAGRPDDAEALAQLAIKRRPDWPDSYLTLAEVHMSRGQWAHAAHWAREVARIGQPETLLIVNPLDYRLVPRLIQAEALARLGEFGEAVEVGLAALEIARMPDLLEAVSRWRHLLRHEETARMWRDACETLVAHDEQLKALRLIEDTVPWFVKDHPTIVDLRSRLRERVRPLIVSASAAGFYMDGGAKPEDFYDDETSLKIADGMPRARFLLDGIKEQIGAV